LNVNVAHLSTPTPARAARTDEPGRILRLAEQWFAEGAVATATLVDIRGGAAKPLGSQMAVAADGRFCGYVSGGCVEAAVATEAMAAMAEGRDRMVMFGDGSPFFDIVLPCGGGITIAIHLLRSVEAIRDINRRLERREQAALRYSPISQSFQMADATARSQWLEGDFLSVFRPRTLVAISGQTLEAEAVANLAEASGYDVTWLDGDVAIDQFTAIVLLHHDLEKEGRALDAALRSEAFYIGSLGSTRTHRKRIARLIGGGRDRKDIDRIKAPIGIFGPTRDATSLALSVLADVAAARLVTYP
jgi:xanthine dehydrogenase accessory factor